MHENNSLGLDEQAAMFGKNMKLMDVVSEIVHMSGGPRWRIGRNAKGEATLPVVVPGTQPKFVITLRYESVVSKPRNVNEPVSVQRVLRRPRRNRNTFG